MDLASGFVNQENRNEVVAFERTSPCSSNGSRKLIAIGFILVILGGHFLALLKLLDAPWQEGGKWIQGFFWMGLCLSLLGGLWTIVDWLQIVRKNLKIPSC